VYIETTVASYLTARPSRDLVVAAHQELTIEWWTRHRQRFDLYISDIVLREAARGDAGAAGKRLAELDGLDVLALGDVARDLARVFMERKLIPEGCRGHASHCGRDGTGHGLSVDVELPPHRERRSCGTACGSLFGIGYRMPVLCTPEQLMGD
jgi:hypothetical protein